METTSYKNKTQAPKAKGLKSTLQQTPNEEEKDSEFIRL